MEQITLTPVKALTEQHITQCAVCQSKYHKSIDRDFLDWRPVTEIAEGYEVSTSSIYRHVRVSGLKAQRQLNLRAYWERMMELTSGRPKVSDGIKASELLAKSLNILSADNNLNVNNQNIVVNVISYKGASKYESSIQKEDSRTVSETEALRKTVSGEEQGATEKVESGLDSK
jgi:hypothetical protein